MSPDLKNLLMPLFFMGCFPGDFHDENGTLKYSGQRPIEVTRRPIKEGKGLIEANGQTEFNFRDPAMVENGPSKKAC